MSFRTLTAAYITLTLATTLPLQLVYADGLLPAKTAPEASKSAESSQPSPEPLKTISEPSQVQVKVSPEELLEVTSASIPLHSKLQKTYQAYKLTLNSQYPGLLHLQSASINNGQNGTMAYELTKASMTPVYMTLLLGLAGFVLIGVPMLCVKNSHNQKSHTEGLPYTNQIPLIDLNQGQTLHFDALVPLGQKPDVSLNFLNRKTGELISKRVVL